VRLNTDWVGYDPSFTDVPGYDTASEPVPWDGLRVSGNVGIGAYSALVLSQDG
jgi:1,4-alpha-glucan branching enzyme